MAERTVQECALAMHCSFRIAILRVAREPTVAGAKLLDSLGHTEAAKLFAVPEIDVPQAIKEYDRGYSAWLAAYRQAIKV